MGFLELFPFIRRDTKLFSDLRTLEKDINYRFRRLELLDIAVTHCSLSPQSVENYERLEFLGDAVIDHIVSRWLYEHYTEEDEGFLTQRRSALVNKLFLAQMGQLLSLDRYIRLDSSVRMQNTKVRTNILGDVFESVIGAVYLDGGIHPARKLIDKTILANSSQAQFDTNFKGQLIEFCHRQELKGPIFRTISVKGPEHNKQFQIEVQIGENHRFVGKGKSKKEAEQESARQALNGFDS